MKRILLLLAAAFCIGSVAAQQQPDLDNFDGLHAQGPLPTDLTLRLNELYTLDKQRVRDYNDGRLPGNDKVLAVSYRINKLISSGRIIFGDPVTRMVETIADTLLHDYPELRRNLRFYTVKSPEVNAFATGQGMIFVNTGLVAHADNEAQLAFIISHEIIHYYRQHATEMLTRKDNTRRRNDEEEELSIFIKRHNRSRQMENEADSLGIALFYSKSPYAKNVTQGVFDVLQYGYLPFAQLPFPHDYFNTPHYRLPDDYFLKELSPVSARDDYNDSLSTHPNLKKRRAKTAAQLADFSGGNDFVTLSRQQFEQIRSLARFECIRLNLIHGEFVRAFYDCYLLLQQYPQNHFLIRSMCQSLYGIAKNKNHTGTNNALGDYTRMEGEVQQVYHLFRRIPADEMTLIAARHLWQAHLSNPADTHIAAMSEDLFAELHNLHHLDTAFFLQPLSDTTSTPKQPAPDNVSLTKYERVKARQQQRQEMNLKAFIFTDLLQPNSPLRQQLPDLLSARNARYTKTPGPYRNQLLYSPGYYNIGSNNYNINYKQSYNNEAKLLDNITAVNSKLGIQTRDFSDQCLTRMSDAGQYNDFVTLNEWVTEYLQTEDKFTMHFLTQPAMNRLMQRHQASVVNLSAVVNLQRGIKPYSVMGMLIVPFAPVFAYSLFANTEQTLLYSQLIDAHSGTSLSTTSRQFNLADHGELLRSNLYAAYHSSDTLLSSAHVADSTPHPAVKGYMGHRLALTALATVSPTFNALKPLQASFFKFSPSFGLEYAVASSASIALGYNLTAYSSSSFPHPFAMHTFSLSYRRYGYQTYAPSGPYAGFGFFFTHFSDGVQQIPTTINNPQTPYRQNFGGIRIELGRNYIFFDRMLLNIGANYALSFTSPENIINGNLTPPEKYSLLSHLVKLEIGIGFLP